MKNPCKDCALRELYCHSTCSDYLSFKQELEEIKNHKNSQQINFTSHSFYNVEGKIRRYNYL